MQIKIGDKVKLQLAKYNGCMYPRQHYYSDYCFSDIDNGPWTDGEVVDIKARSADPDTLKYKIQIYSLPGDWWFLIENFNNPAFPGGPTTNFIRCECGADKTARGGNAYGAHSHWCPKWGR